MSDVVIRAENIRKSYRVYKNNWQKIRSLLLGLKAGRRRNVLRDISFEVRKGEKVGIIGFPHSGKTTLLKILSGVTEPNSGHVEISGKVTSVLNYRMGFMAAMSSVDNYAMRCKLLGWTEEQAAECEEAVFEYAGLMKEKYRPMSQLNTGRASLFGFAIYTARMPDIMIYDESFSLGSQDLSDEAVRRLKKLTSGDETTLVMSVNHREYASMLCERGIVIHKGVVVYDGPFDEALEYYDTSVKGSIKNRK